jgi:hypothetical protein
MIATVKNNHSKLAMLDSAIHAMDIRLGHWTSLEFSELAQSEAMQVVSQYAPRVDAKAFDLMNIVDPFRRMSARALPQFRSLSPMGDVTSTTGSLPVMVCLKPVSVPPQRHGERGSNK